MPGTNLTNAFAGVMEYDGSVFYGTPAMGQRGIISTSFYRRTGSANTLTGVLTSQSIANARLGGLTVTGLTTYEFEGAFCLVTSGTTSHTEGFSFVGSATYSDISYRLERISSNANSVPIVTFGTVATNIVITPAITTAQNAMYQFKGTCRINAGGTLNPSITFSADPTGISTILAGAWFKMTPIGGNSVDLATGNWGI